MERVKLEAERIIKNMNKINEFSQETINKIGYYVYRLIDPRNGQTFYVGKGKGNRVFQHVLGAIGYYDGVDKKKLMKAMILTNYA